MLKATPKNAAAAIIRGKSLDYFSFGIKKSQKPEQKHSATYQQNKTISIDVLWHYVFAMVKVTP
jgi:hypothetical protein